MPVKNGPRAGKIAKPYGLSGGIHLILDPAAGKHIKPGNPLFIDIDGQRVPFFVEEFEQVSAEQAIAKFEFIDTIEGARSISGCDIFLEGSHTLSGTKSRDEFSSVIGYDAFDLKTGYLGTVTGFLHEEMNPLFQVTGKDGEILVPAAEEIIQKIDHRERLIRFDLPEGLLGL